MPDTISENCSGNEASRYLDKNEVAKLFGITRRTLEEWMKRRFVPFYKIGRTVRFDRGAIHSHLESSCKVGGAH